MSLLTRSASAPPRTPDRGIDGFPVRKKLQHMKEECTSVQGENCGCYRCVEKHCLKRRWHRVNADLLRARKAKRTLAMRINRLKGVGLGEHFDELDDELATIAERGSNDSLTDEGETDSNASQAGCSDQEEISEEDAAHLGGETFACGDCGNMYSLGAQCLCGY